MTEKPSGWTNPPPDPDPQPEQPPAQSPLHLQWRTGGREELQKRLLESSDDLYRVLFKTIVSHTHGRDVPMVAVITTLLDISHDLLINTGQL